MFDTKLFFRFSSFVIYRCHYSCLSLLRIFYDGHVDYLIYFSYFTFHESDICALLSCSKYHRWMILISNMILRVRHLSNVLKNVVLQYLPDQKEKIVDIKNTRRDYQ